MSKVNFITWRVIDVHSGLTYALSLRQNSYHCLPLLGNNLGATAIQQIVDMALQQLTATDLEPPEIPEP